MLYLTLAGNGAISTPERLNGIDARVIEALPQLGLEPISVGPLLGVQLEDERVSTDRLGLPGLRTASPVIHQTLAKMGVVDVIGQSRILALVHKERERKSVQYALNGPLPFGLVRLHLDEFANKGKCRLRDPDGGGDVSTHFQHVRRNVRWLSLECLHLFQCLRKRGLGILLFSVQAELLGAAVVAALLPVFDLLPRVAQQFCESLRRIREAPPQLLACLFRLTAFAQTICALDLQPRFLGLPLLDLITACLTVLSLQIAQDCGVVIQGALTSPHLTL